MEFEWDENKNKSNQEKHGIDFNDAKEKYLKTKTAKYRKIYVKTMVKFVGEL